MWRLIIFVFGAAVLALVGAYFWSGKPWCLQWARRLFLTGLSVGLAFFVVLLLSRLL